MKPSSTRSSNVRAWNLRACALAAALLCVGPATAATGCTDCTPLTTETTATTRVLTAEEAAIDVVDASNPTEYDLSGLTTDEQAPLLEAIADPLAPMAGTVGERPGDLDRHFQGGALVDTRGKSSNFPYAANGGMYPSTDLRTLGIGVEPRSVILNGQPPKNFGDRYYTIALQAYVNNRTRLIVSRHKPNGRVDSSFGGNNGLAAGSIFYEIGLTGAGGVPLQFVPLKALPVFQAASGTRPQYQRFVVLGSVQLSTTRRSYGLLCMRVTTDQRSMEPCPNFDYRGWDWPQDFFQNDRIWVTDLAWLPGNPGHIIAVGQVRNNPANYQDLDPYVAKHSMADGELVTSFGSTGYRVHPVEGTSRDFINTVTIQGGAITMGGSSASGSTVRGLAVQVDDYNGTLKTSFCPASATEAECGPATVRSGKRVFLPGSNPRATVTAIAARSSRLVFVQDVDSGKLRMRETDGNGKSNCSASSGLPACRTSANITGYGPIEVLYAPNGTSVDLFTYSAPPGGVGSGINAARYTGSLTLDLFVGSDDYSTEGATHKIDFPTFDSTAVYTRSAYLAKDSHGRYLATSVAKYNTSVEFYNRVATLRLKADVIFDHGFDF